VRFTRNGDVTYAVVLTDARSGETGIGEIAIPEGGSVRLLGGGALDARNTDGGIAYTLNGDLPAGPAYTLAIG